MAERPDNRLENIRMYFPAEATGAYLAIQALLVTNSIPPTERADVMIGVIVALGVINVAIYYRFYAVKSVFLHAILLFGFVIWAINVDTPRFKNVRLLNNIFNVEILAPVLLIFYSILTLFIAAPQRTPNATDP
jgi:hypothetical protein